MALCLAILLGSRPARAAGRSDASADPSTDNAASLGPETVTATVGRALGALWRCYQPAQARNPALHGRLFVGWTIDIAGAVGHSRTELDELGDPALTACARAVVERMRFTPSPAGPLEISYPFIFQRDGVRLGIPRQWPLVPAGGATAVEIARNWLSAIRWADTPAIRKGSAYPLAIEGFNLDSGTGREACDGKPRSDGIAGVRSFHALDSLKVSVETPDDLERGLRCLLADTFLREDIPRANPDGSWPTAPRNFDDHLSGRLKVVTPSRLSKHLRRYRQAAERLARDHTLVQAIMTDNDGETTSVLVALRSDPDHLFLVDAAFIDELFEE